MCAVSIAGPWLGRQEIRRAVRERAPCSAKMVAPAPAAPDVTPMSFKDLLESWRENAAQPRTATEYAVRLPMDDAARLAALAEMFPGRTAEQLITDLLGAALQEI